MLKVNSVKVFNKNENCENINLIIGPNNSGKSVFIKEIADSIKNVIINGDNKWIKEIQLISDDIISAWTKFVPESF